jgi:hypothetical protein
VNVLCPYGNGDTSDGYDVTFSLACDKSDSDVVGVKASLVMYFTRYYKVAFACSLPPK